ETGICKRLGAKEYPGQQHYEQCQAAGEQRPHKLIEAIVVEDCQWLPGRPGFMRGEGRAMNPAPDDKIPTRPVPKAAKEHRHHHIPRCPKNGIAAVSCGHFKRKENVIPEPSRKCDM